jgi:polygalacturonase
MTIINKKSTDTITPTIPTNLIATVIKNLRKDIIVPTVPRNLTASKDKIMSQIDLAWSASTDNVAVTGYKVFRNGTQIATTNGISYSDNDPLLIASTPYTYTISSFDAAGNNSAQSASATFTILTLISAVSSFNITTTSADVSWTVNEPASGQVEYGTTIAYGNLSTFEALTNNPTHVHHLIGLTPGTGYHYRIHSINQATLEYISRDFTFTTAAIVDTTAPTVPNNLAGVAVSTNQVNLTWTASTDAVGVTGYKIFRDGVQIGISTVPSYSNAGISVSTATTYIYTVLAYDAASNNSAQSTSVSVTISPSLFISAISAHNITTTGAIITWTVSEPATGQVEYGTTTAYGLLSTRENSFNYTTHSQTLVGLTPGTLYHFRVHSVNQAGTEVISADLTFTAVINPRAADFLPLGIYYTGGVESYNGDANKWAKIAADLDDIAAHNINTVWLVNMVIADMAQFATLASARGIALVAAPNEIQGTNSAVMGGNHATIITDAMTAWGTAPKPLAWGLADEPLTHNSATQTAYTTYVADWHTNAPGEPVTVIAMPSDVVSSEACGVDYLTEDAYTFFYYNGGSNGYVDWLYAGNYFLIPSGNPHPSMMGQAHMMPDGPWQYSSTGNVVLLPGGTFKQGRPTPNQIKYQAFAAFAVGSKGMYSFIYKWIQTPQPTAAASTWRSGADNVTVNTDSGFPIGLVYANDTTTTQYEALGQAYLWLKQHSPLISSLTLNSTTATDAWETTDEGVGNVIKTFTQAVTGNTYMIVVSGYDHNSSNAIPISLNSAITTLINTESGIPLTISAHASSIILSPASAAILQYTVTSDTIAPTVPTNLAGTSVSSTQINLTWTASTDAVGVTGYKVFRNGTQIAIATGTSYSNINLSSPATYVYTISAYDAAGNNSAQTSGVSVTLGSSLVISAVSAFNITNTSADINWTISSPATGQVEYGTTTAYGLLTTLENSFIYTNQTQHIAGLTQGTLYHYRTHSVDAAGNVAYSGDFTFTANGAVDTIPPTVPTNLAATGISSSQINLTWTASSDNVGVTGYTVFRNGTQIAVVIGSSYVDSVPTQGTYSYTISAHDAANNNSALSNSVNGTTITSNVVSVRNTGATGNGSTDDTAAIQTAINQVGGTGGTVLVPDGTYLVTIDDSAWPNPALNLRSNMTFHMTSGAIIKLRPNSKDSHVCLYLQKIDAVNIIGDPGSLVLGERYQHTSDGTNADAGFGIEIDGSTNILVQGVTSKDFFGDGVDFYSGTSIGSRNVTIDGVTCDNNRRQGMSIEYVDGVIVKYCTFKNTNGTSPQHGIDIEPDPGGYHRVNNVNISHCTFSNNAGGGFLIWKTANAPNNTITNTVLNGTLLPDNTVIDVSDANASQA